MVNSREYEHIQRSIVGNQHPPTPKLRLIVCSGQDGHVIKETQEVTMATSSYKHKDTPHVK